MTTVFRDGDGVVRLDMSEDELAVDFSIVVDSYVPTDDEDALREEIARRLGWDSDRVSIRFVSHDGMRKPNGRPPSDSDYETTLQGVYYVDAEE